MTTDEELYEQYRTYRRIWDVATFNFRFGRLHESFTDRPLTFEDWKKNLA